MFKLPGMKKTFGDSAPVTADMPLNIQSERYLRYSNCPDFLAMGHGKVDLIRILENRLPGIPPHRELLWNGQVHPPSKIQSARHDLPILVHNLPPHTTIEIYR